VHVLSRLGGKKKKETRATFYRPQHAEETSEKREEIREPLLFRAGNIKRGKNADDSHISHRGLTIAT